MFDRIKNLSVPHRLYGAFAVQVLLLGATSLFVYGHVAAIRLAVIRVVSVGLPLEHAVEEMERNTVAFSSSVLSYSDSLDPVDVQRADEALDKFAGGAERVRKLARTSSQRSLLHQANELHAKLEGAGRALMTSADTLAEQQKALEISVAATVEDLESRIGSVDRTAPNAAALLEAGYGMKGALAEARAATMLYGESPDSRTREEVSAAMNRFTRHAAFYDSMADRGDVYTWLAAARDRGNDVKTRIGEYLDAVDKHSAELGAFRASVDGLATRLSQEMRPLIAQDRTQVQSAVDRAVARTQTVILTIAFLGLCLGVGLAMWSSVGIMRPLQEVVHKLNETSDRLALTSADRAAGAQQQVASVAESMATVTEVARTAEQAADRAATVADSVRQTDTIAQSGRSAVGVAVTAMARAKDQTHSIAENIVALAEQAKAIGEIIASVNEIAEQTNLLSLNASIEASRAGEHGKGFQVVAGEVKELAGQSKMATRQVREILGEIQKATSSAVLSTEDGTDTVENAVEVVSQAGDTINSLAETIANAANAASQIAAHATQQATAMTQIKNAMQDIDKVAQSNAFSAREIQEMAADLSGLGAELQVLVRGGLS
jgi:DNA-binding ferritin-like protein